MNETRISNGSSYVKPPEDPFRPMPTIEGGAQTLALSTYVRPRGSMCGRSVLRAAGMAKDPYGMRAKPQHQPQRGMVPQANARSRWYGTDAKRTFW
ncbi:MAG: hypothetical protein RSD76_02670 [Clostridia bacterium]